MNKLFIACLFLLSSFAVVGAQQPASEPNEKRVPVTETAIALDSSGSPVLEAMLGTTSVTGSAESPVTNVRITVRNSSAVSFALVSGVVTFYDSSGVRCAEGVFKSEALASGEQFETDVPGIRIRCAAGSWRVVAISLVPRYAPAIVPVAVEAQSRVLRRLLISIDGEQHPIQLDKPMKLSLGDKERTIIVREAP